MWTKKTRARNFKIGSSIKTSFEFTFFLLTIILSLPESKITEWQAGALSYPAFLLSWIQDNGLIIVIINTLVLGIGWLFTLSGDPDLKNDLQATLDEFRDDFFSDYEEDYSEFSLKHRVTIFERQQIRFRIYPKRGFFGFGKKDGKWFFPWTGWLVPVMRSGHVYSQKPSVFLASKNNETQIEGIAGALWREGKGKKGFTKQNLRLMQSITNPRKKEEYARSTNVNLEYLESALKAGKNLPRSIGGFTIKTERKIFVIVLDSTEPNAVNDKCLLEYPMTMSILSRLLERV